LGTERKKQKKKMPREKMKRRELARGIELKRNQRPIYCLLLSIEDPVRSVCVRVCV